MKTLPIILGFLLTFLLSTTIRAADTVPIEAFLSRWRQAQLNRQIDTYRALYSPHFTCGDVDLKTWMRDKRIQFANYGPLSLDISEVYINRKNSVVEATFLSQSRGHLISEIGKKKLSLEKNDATWQIRSEAWQVVSGFVDLADPGGLAGQPETGLRINSISYQIERNGMEKLMIEFNQFYAPEPFVLEKDRVRVVFDIHNITAWNGPKTMPVNGQWIKRVRSHLYHDTGMLRIVLDMTPSQNYNTKPFFYKAENIYSLEITKAPK